MVKIKEKVIGYEVEYYNVFKEFMEENEDKEAEEY